MRTQNPGIPHLLAPFYNLNPLEDGCNALAATNTHGDQSGLAVDALQLVQRFDGDQRARRTDGVAQ